DTEYGAATGSGIATGSGTATEFGAPRQNDLLIDAILHSGRETRHQSLSQGNVIFAPVEDMIVETPHGTISLAAGAIALVMQSDSGLAVYDLHDQSKNAVVVTTRNKQLSLSPGRHATISSRSARSFDDINPIELVQYRGLTQCKLDNGWNVHTAE